MKTASVAALLVVLIAAVALAAPKAEPPEITDMYLEQSGLYVIMHYTCSGKYSWVEVEARGAGGELLDQWHRRAGDSDSDICVYGDGRVEIPATIRPRGGHVRRHHNLEIAHQPHSNHETCCCHA